MGACGPVIELMTPILTWDTASAGTARSAAATRERMRFICFDLRDGPLERGASGCGPCEPAELHNTPGSAERRERRDLSAPALR